MVTISLAVRSGMDGGMNRSGGGLGVAVARDGVAVAVAWEAGLVGRTVGVGEAEVTEVGVGVAVAGGGDSGAWAAGVATGDGVATASDAAVGDAALFDEDSWQAPRDSRIRSKARRRDADIAVGHLLP